MIIAVNEMNFDMSMKTILSRKLFTDFFLEFLLLPFRNKSNNKIDAKLEKIIYNFFLAIQEVFNNVDQHGINTSIDCKEEVMQNYCKIRIEITEQSIYFFCRDFGYGMDKKDWDVIINQTGGGAFLNPKHNFVDESELISVGQGTFIKLVKHLGDIVQ